MTQIVAPVETLHDNGPSIDPLVVNGSIERLIERI